MRRQIGAEQPFPPSAATRSQTRNASENETPWLAVAVGRPDAVSEVYVTAAALPGWAAAGHCLLT
jgi:hypothetical protein